MPFLFSLLGSFLVNKKFLFKERLVIYLNCLHAINNAIAFTTLGSFKWQTFVLLVSSDCSYFSLTTYYAYFSKCLLTKYLGNALFL